MDPLTIAQMVPVALNTISSIKTLLTPPEIPNVPVTRVNNKIFKKGGTIRGYNKYNAPSHGKGGQTVNKNGIPSPGTNNEVEGKESKFTYSTIKNSTYVFTPVDARKVDKIVNKYKNADKSSTDRAAMELEIQRIENENEMKKTRKQTNKFASGGPLTGGLTALSALSEVLGKRNYGMVDPIPTLTSPGVIKGAYQTKTINPNPLAVDQGNLSLDALNQATLTPGSVPNDSNGANSTNPLPDSLTALEGLRTALTVGNSLGLLKGAEKETPIMTDYSKGRSELGKMNANLDVQRQSAAQTSNQMRNINRNSASSYNAYQNREASRVANLQQTLGGINLSEQQMKNNIAMTKAQFETGAARETAQTLRQNRIDNLANQATADGIKSQISGDIMHELDRKSTIINEANIATASRAEGMALMSTMFTNFKPGDYDILYKVASKGPKSLTPDEFIRYQNLEPVKYKDNG